MFPELTTRETLNLVTNPHHFQMNGLDFLGTSGQSVHDMQLFANFAKASALDCLRMQLQIRHLCPSTPDTLRAFPYKSEDPFVIAEKGPDVYFAGC